ncbi:SulP family inorganic anion transporter [Acinetobacter sp. ANC 4641]|uniref:SulP family inorganic anion transporter n=1 Tax=Acinetobacter sp. ANC 4641 TaxID=2529847 RepID=UPI00103959C6|nr:SulP family inorganic anion transporter [Acinetobacter sp. ANC 4641]TCB12360.1 SulP family inorganic anion transporter [Acinetobacter sp. ANC 4641]
MTIAQKIPIFDVIAGLSIAGLLLPEAVAYSNIAGLSPQSGLVALVLGLVIYGLIGHSRFAIVSSTSSSAAVMSSGLATIVVFSSPERATLAYALVFLSGILLVIAGLFKLGEVTHFIAKPVLKGFSFGLALSIVVKQLPAVIQFHPEHSGFFRQLWEMLQAYSSWNWHALGMGLSAFLILQFTQRYKTIPVALLLIILGIGLNLMGYTQEWGIRSVGHFEFVLPSASLPHLSMNSWLELVEMALAVALIIYAESYTSIRTFALKYNDPSEPNRDLIALGMGNICSGLLKGMTVGAGYSATSANEAAGAKSKKSAWVAALAVVIFLLCFRQYIANIPEPILASIVMYAVSGHIRFAPFKQYFIWRKDRLLSMVAIWAVIVFGVLNGLVIAIIVSILMMLKSYSVPRIAWLGRMDGGHDFVDIDRFPEAVALDGILIARPDHPMFFANAEKISNAIIHKLSEQNYQHVILNLEECPSLDSTSVEELLQLATQLQDKQIDLQLARVRRSVAETLLYVNSPLLPQSTYAAQSVDDAVNRLQRRASAAT